MFMAFPVSFSCSGLVLPEGGTPLGMKVAEFAVKVIVRAALAAWAEAKINAVKPVFVNS